MRGMEKGKRNILLLFLVIAAAFAVMLTSILALKVTVSVVCVIMLIEAALVLCMRNVPVWLHGLLMIGQVVAGVIVKNALFMILCAVFYLFGILMLDLTKDERKGGAA